MISNYLFPRVSLEAIPLSTILDTPLREVLPTLFGIERLEDLDGEIGWRVGVVTVWFERAVEVVE